MRKQFHLCSLPQFPASELELPGEEAIHVGTQPVGIPQFVHATGSYHQLVLVVHRDLEVLSGLVLEIAEAPFQATADLGVMGLPASVVNQWLDRIELVTPYQGRKDEVRCRRGGFPHNAPLVGI